MAKKSRLLSVLKAAEDLLIVFDSYFRDPVWVTNSLAVPTDKAQRQLNYLRRNNKLDDDYSPINREKQVLSLVNQDWDELWRVVGYDIPENKRTERRMVRKNLHELGFKQLQRSVWVSPLAVDEYIKDLARQNEPTDFSFFVGRLFGQSSKKIVQKLWSVGQWKKEAKSLLAELKDEDKNADKCRKIFWDLILSHPKVPRDLLPFYWPLEDLTAAFVAKING